MHLFLDHDVHENESVLLTGEEAHYLTHVLRRRPGDEFTVVTPTGQQAVIRLTVVSRTAVEGQVVALGEAPSLPAAHVALYAGLLKQKGFELLLQKTTEVGAAEIYPLLTEHTVVRPAPSGCRPRWSAGTRSPKPPGGNASRQPCRLCIRRASLPRPCATGRRRRCRA